MPPELDNDVRVENRLYPLPSRFAERRTAAVGLGYAQRPDSAQGFRAAIGFSEPVSATTRSVSTAQVRHRGRLSFVEEPARAELSQAEWNFRRPGPQRWYRPWCLAIWARLLWRRSRTWPHCPIRKISLTREPHISPGSAAGYLPSRAKKMTSPGCVLRSPLLLEEGVSRRADMTHVLIPNGACLAVFCDGHLLKDCCGQ